MESMIEVIRRRVSIRTYDDRPIEDDKKQRILDLLRPEHRGPFGHSVRFALVDLSEQDKDEIRHLGTYGVIKGASLYIVAAVNHADRSMVDLGYCFETVILEVTRLGLGTCWLGGTFNRAGFARRIGLEKSEVVPAITPVGYARSNRSVLEATMRRMVGSDKRRSWPQLFFQGDLQNPLYREAADRYTVPLDCLRLAPSASNRQPWRIVKSKDANAFHFLLKRTPGYGKLLMAADLQLVDMGIGMSHFELAARETGLDGTWNVSDLDFDGTKAEYIITWTG